MTVKLDHRLHAVTQGLYVGLPHVGLPQGSDSVADPEGARSRRASSPPPPVQAPQNKKTAIFRPKYGIECVI